MAKILEMSAIVTVPVVSQLSNKKKTVKPQQAGDAKGSGSSGS